MSTPEQLKVIDAAIDVSVFSKTRKFPKEGTPEFFEFNDLLHKLQMAIRRAYPQATFFK